MYGFSHRITNLVPRVQKVFGQRVGAGRDSGELEFYYRRISAAKQCKLSQGSQENKILIFEFPRVSPGDQPLAKEPEESGYEIAELQFRNTQGDVMTISKPWQVFGSFVM